MTQSMADVFAEEEAKMMAQAKAEMAAEQHRYETDPVYRANVDAERAAKQEAMKDIDLETLYDEEEEEDEDEEE